jgi:hypothetical protein
MGFWASKTLLTAVEIGVFTELGHGPEEFTKLRNRLGLHPRAARDFFDALVALGLLERNEGGVYSNTPETGFFLDRRRPTYIGGLLEMANARLYGFWGSLTEALRTGRPQNEIRDGQEPFEAIYSSPQRLRAFLAAMSGVSLGSSLAMAAKFPWDRYQTFVDVGTAQGQLPVQVARAHSHLRGVGFDLAEVGPIFEEFVEAQGLADRVSFQPGNFFEDPLPQADVLVMGHILHDWSLEQKMMLLRKAHDALPPEGALIVYEALIDDERRHNAFGLLMSLNMLIETTAGFDFTGADCQGWMKEVGFRETRVEHLVGPDWMVIGIK